MLDFSIRIFGSNECDRCQSLKKAFEFHGIPFDYIDANDPLNNPICDAHEVDELPQVEAYFSKTNNTFYKFVGYINPHAFIERAIVKNSNIEQFYDKTLDEAKKNVDMQKLTKQIEQNRKNGGCSTCGRNKNVK